MTCWCERGEDREKKSAEMTRDTTRERERAEKSRNEQEKKKREGKKSEEMSGRDETIFSNFLRQMKGTLKCKTTNREKLRKKMARVN